MIGICRKSVVLLLLSVLLLKSVCGQNNHTILHYNSKNGLPQNDLTSMAIDSLGFVWTISDLGVVRFDGRNFKEFNTSNCPDFAGNYFYSFFQTATHELLATDIYGSLFTIQNGKINCLKKGDIDAINYIEINGVLPSSDFYKKYTTPLWRVAKDSTWEYPPLKIFSQSKTDFVIQSKAGLEIYQNNKAKHTIKLDGYTPKWFFCLGHNVYFANADLRLYYFDLKQFSVVPCTSNLAELLGLNLLSVNDIKLFNDFENNVAYLVSGYKLFRIFSSNLPNILSIKTVTDSLPRNTNVTNIAYSNQHQFLAISTSTNGIYIFKENKFKTLTHTVTQSGTSNGYYSQAEIDSNTLLTDWGLNFTINGAQKGKYPIIRNNEENIIKDKHGNFYYSNGDSLLKFDPNKNSVKLIAYSKNNRAVSYHEEGDSIIIGNLKTLAYIKNDSLITIADLSTPQSNINPYNAFFEKKNRLWFTNIKGAYVYDLQTKIIDTIKPLYKKMVHNVLLYRDFIFIGTYGGGYYLYKEGKIVQMPVDRDNLLLNVHAFVIDSSGYIWMTTNRGIFKTKYDQLVHYFNDTTFKVDFLYYDEKDGIRNTEFNGGCPTSALRLKNGFVSLATMEGLVWYRPETFIDDYSKSKIFIDAVYLDDIKATSLKSINSNVENIRFEVSSPFWGNPDNLLIEYKLNGYSRQWKTLNSKQNYIEFTNLHSGNYTLELRKKVGFNTDDYVTQSISFYIEKKFYETIWFLILVILFFMVLIGAIARLYAANIERKNKNLERKVHERTQELKLANEQLQSSINVKDKLISIVSHDIVTPLRFISLVARRTISVSNEVEKETIYNSMVDIKNASEKLYGNAQNILNWIKHHNNRFTVTITHVAISSLVDDVSTSLTELANEKGNQILNEISHDDIIKSDKNILSIILNNLVSNAIKFTVNGTITLSAYQQNEHYFILVTDTGSGIKADKLERIQNIIDKQNIKAIVGEHGDGNNGLGYLIITELIDLIKGKITVTSTPDIGTTIKLTIPV